MTTPTATTGLAQSQANANTERPNGARRVGLLGRAWRGVAAVFGTLLGLLPHVLHHAGLIFGAALVTGAGGNLLFGVLGLLFSMPLLRHLYIRFDTWKAPAIALAVFVGMFSLSAFVIGPNISGDTVTETPSPVQTSDHTGHDGH
ncbi:hypothetical protein LL946_10425 [Knoellia locipacati]|uniref:hypothetical protein n=1 Tax=Knoellia locipacati TaxID=882824 RepID=UPI00384D4C60